MQIVIFFDHLVNLDFFYKAGFLNHYHKSQKIDKVCGQKSRNVNYIIEICYEVVKAVEQTYTATACRTHYEKETQDDVTCLVEQQNDHDEVKEAIKVPEKYLQTPVSIAKQVRFATVELVMLVVHVQQWYQRFDR